MRHERLAALILFGGPALVGCLTLIGHALDEREAAGRRLKKVQLRGAPEGLARGVLPVR